MIYHIITIFPEAFESFLSTSIIAKAQQKWAIHISLYKLNDFSPETSGHIDAKAYGMHGQVLRVEPLTRAIEHIFSNTKKVIPIIYFSPKGLPLTQQYFEKFWKTVDECILICGHYEWIDERVIELFDITKISLWDYIVTGGELPAQIFIDGVSRLLPNVLWNSLSYEEESFSQKLDRQTEYPVYTRPQIFRWKSVPDVLLSWNHHDIEQWKKNNLWK